MTRDDRVEQLARAWAEHEEGDSGVAWSWDDEDMGEFRDAWRARAADMMDVMDLIGESGHRWGPADGHNDD